MITLQGLAKQRLHLSAKGSGERVVITWSYRKRGLAWMMFLATVLLWLSPVYGGGTILENFDNNIFIQRLIYNYRHLQV